MVEFKTTNRDLSPGIFENIPTEITGQSHSANIVLASAESQIETWGFTPVWLLVTLVSVPLAASLFWWLGTRFFGSTLSFFEYHQFCVVVTGVVAGGYQLYFWVQRNNLHIPSRCMKIFVDDWIPFWPRWVWLYSLLYYVMIGFTVMSLHDLAQGMHLIFGGLILLTIGALFYYLFPTTIPKSYRDFKVNSLSTRYLAFVQGMDNDRNAFPSMHCAIATYIGLIVTAIPTIGPWMGYGYITVIASSCLLIKQHVFVDTVVGITLGAVVYYGNLWLGTLT